jgi:hypothetical protein
MLSSAPLAERPQESVDAGLRYQALVENFDRLTASLGSFGTGSGASLSSPAPAVFRAAASAMNQRRGYDDRFRLTRPPSCRWPVPAGFVAVATSALATATLAIAALPLRLPAA